MGFHGRGRDHIRAYSQMTNVEIAALCDVDETVLHAQVAAVSYIQYFTHLPTGLVWVHVTGSVLVWIAVLRLFFAVRDRGPVNTAQTRPRAAVPARQPEVLDR